MLNSAVYRALTSTVRCLKMAGGIVAFAPLLNWIAMKTAMISPKPMNRPYTREEFHGYTVPPHCRARMRHVTPLMRKSAPSRSIWAIFSLNVSVEVFRFGDLKKKKTLEKAMAPKGRLIQKHLSIRV